jgi:gas vesicle protein
MASKNSISLEEVTMSDRDSSGLLTFLLGVTTGALLGVLFAPAPGRETRKRVAEYLDEIEEKSAPYIEEGKKKIRDFVDQNAEKVVSKFMKDSDEEA